MEVHLWMTVVILHVLATSTNGETGDNVKAVLTDVFTTRAYNKKIRPIVDQSRTVDVGVDFFLNSVIDFDEKTESLKTSGYLSLVWNDQYFTWDSAAFNGTNEVFVPQDDIWKPDISLKNSFKSFTGLGSSYLNVVINDAGLVWWNPYQVLESTCSITITYFPFDVQTCDLKFTAWSYTKSQVEINKGSKGILLEEYLPNASWDILDTSAAEINTDEAAVVFTLKLKRKPRFYVINIIIPVIFLSVLNMFSFVIPVTSGERAGYSITVFLSLAVFLTIVSDKLPNNSENTSLLAIYIMLVSGLSTGIVAVCMMQLRLQHWNDTQKPVGKVFRVIVHISNFMKCRTCRRKSVVPKDDTSSKPDLKELDKEERSSETWLDVVNAMDFLFFIIAFIYTFLCTLIIGVIAVNSSG